MITKVVETRSHTEIKLKFDEQTDIIAIISAGFFPVRRFGSDPSLKQASNKESSEIPATESDERCAREKIDGKECSNSDIKVYVMHKGESLPICERCADELADSEWETT